MQRGFAKGDTRIWSYGSRPRITKEVRETLEAATLQAACKLINMLNATYGLVVPDGHGASHIEMLPDNDLQFRAANAIFDRLYGKAPQAIEIDNVETPARAAFDPAILTDEEFKALEILKAAQKRINEAGEQ